MADREDASSEVGAVTGRAGELIERLVTLADDPAAQIRAVVTTLLIKAVVDERASELIALMVASDAASTLIDAERARRARDLLRDTLQDAMGTLALEHGEAHVIRTWREYLLGQMERWASSAVNDADNRRRAERLLVLADSPTALKAAQRRGFLTGLSPDDVRELARTRSSEPVSPETAIDLWSKREAFIARATDLLGEAVILRWEVASSNAGT